MPDAVEPILVVGSVALDTVHTPTETARETIKNPAPGEKPRIMDGCDPMFSPVTMPSMAHLAGRCIG